MSTIGQTLAIILLFTLIGGFFAASETALVSLRDSQVQRLASQDPRRGPRLLHLVANPNRFLAAVQVGVTLAGFVSAGFGASRVVPVVAPKLEDFGMLDSVAETIALIGSTLIIAYISLVLGELVPKRLALQKAESVALLVAAPIDVIARVSRPFIWLLSASTNVMVRLLGLDPDSGRELITGEELRGIVATHTELSAEERELIDDVFEAGDTELREVMIPRTEVEFLAATMPVFRAAAIVSKLPHSRYPIIGDSADDVLGFVHVRDILAPGTVARSIRLEELARDVAFFPGSKAVIPALAEMRKGGHHLAVVVDEYGGTAGIVTLEDLVEELVGDIHDEYDSATAKPRRGPGEPLSVDGLLSIEDFGEETGLELPEGPYETAAGWMVERIGRLPQVGDEITFADHRVTVIELDGRRISRLRVTPVPPAPEPAAAAIDQPVGDSADPAADGTAVPGSG